MKKKAMIRNYLTNSETWLSQGVGFKPAWLSNKTKGLNSVYLSAHMINRLLQENWKLIPNFFNGKNNFKNVTLQILNFTALIQKGNENLTLHHMGKTFISYM